MKREELINKFCEDVERLNQWAIKLQNLLDMARRTKAAEDNNDVQDA